MVTQICIMGDSQTGALKRGWPLIESDYGNVKITFFAGVGAEWQNVIVRDNELCPQTEKLRAQFETSSKGQVSINASFDAYAICGLGLGISRFLNAALTAGTEVSDAGQQHMRRKLRTTTSARILTMLRSITENPIFLIAVPHQPADFSTLAPRLSNETARSLSALFEIECRLLANCCQAQFLPQPTSTVSENLITTKMKYASLESKRGREDHIHCNVEYGALVLKRLLETPAGHPVGA